MNKPNPGAFLAGARPVAVQGNTPWAAAMAREVIEVCRRASARAPRSQQVHLGPSEIGVACDRQIVGKLLSEPKTNHVVDPWPSIVGTAVHAWLADAFELDNENQAGPPSSWPRERADLRRWHTERRVVPHPDHAGTADLYDARERAVLDHKVLGGSSMAKVRAASGPPRKYVAQLGLYALGYLREGFPVERVGLIAYPRTGSSLDGTYVWETPMDAGMAALLTEVFADMERRKYYALAVTEGRMRLTEVPITPTQDECYFCPFYRPDAASAGAGCDGKRPHLSTA